MSELPRRAVLAGAVALPLAGCTTPGQAPSSTPVAGQRLAAVADVPVGSGTIVDGTVITQPTAGVFRAFAARCTHAGCALTAITDGEVLCPCHGSRFNLDGSVARGPATEPLRPRTVSVQGGDIVSG